MVSVKDSINCSPDGLYFFLNIPGDNKKIMNEKIMNFLGKSYDYSSNSWIKNKIKINRKFNPYRYSEYILEQVMKKGYTYDMTDEFGNINCINCNGCVNCVDCKNSDNCSNSYELEKSQDCSECIYCKNCKSLTNSKYCNNLSKYGNVRCKFICQKCKRFIIPDYCGNCCGQSKCEYCKFCEDC